MSLRRLDVDGLDAVRFTEGTAGPPLVPVVAQDATTGSVLMLAWADRTALETSLATGAMHYWSRSRNTLWQKGETSGHTQAVDALYLDCDADAVLALVHQNGPACHTESATCWQTEGDGARPVAGILGALERLVAERRADPQAGSYTTRLLSDENLRLKKVQEESGEFLVAAARADPDGMRHEAADLLYHLLVALQGAEVPLEDVLQVLDERRK